jgi:hypothetical protein
MGAGDLELLDVSYTADSDDEARLKIGDNASNAGVGTDCAYLATDGFVSMPNPPDGNGSATCIAWTPGNDRFVLAAMDGRYNDKAGSLNPGDRAIVSNCAAYLKLSQSGNSISLASTNTGVSCDGTGGKVTLYAGTLSVTLDGTGNKIIATWTDGAGTTATMALGPTTSIPISLSVTGPAGAASIYLSAILGGQINISAPGGVIVNGTPLTFSGGAWV